MYFIILQCIVISHTHTDTPTLSSSCWYSLDLSTSNSFADDALKLVAPPPCSSGWVAVGVAKEAESTGSDDGALIGNCSSMGTASPSY